jgi:YD repeat-containing protein
VADPDDSSANSASVCAKSTGVPGWNTQTTRSYFPSGAVQSIQSPAQRSGGVATSFTYDLDGNPTTETHHYACTGGGSCTPGVTTKWYDSADRLIEVRLPHDATDYYWFPWSTRYLYDLSSGGSVSIEGTSFRAYGNLYKTEEWNGSSWVDLRASAFDAMDRAVTKYTFSPSSAMTLRAATMTYDATTATLGLLSSTTDPLGETTTVAYDSMGQTTSLQFTGDSGVTPNKTFVYDPNGRETSAYSTVYGTEATRYDPDGRVSEVDEPIAGSMTSPARITFDYYPNGQRKDVNVASSAVTASPLISYAYRNDGRRTKLHIGYGQQQRDFIWTYSDGGRPTSQSDPFTGTAMPSPQAPVAAGTAYPPMTKTYDASGQLTQLQLPETLAYTVAHDYEGDVVSFTGSNSTNGPMTMNYTHTIRGESVGQAFYPSAPQATSRIANGAAVPLKTAPGSGKLTENAVVDLKNAVVASWTYEKYIPYNDPNSDPESGLADCGTMTDAQDYDAAGRLLGHTLSGPGSSDSHCADIGATLAVNHYYSYDAENHHIGTKGGSWSSTGHVYNLGGTSIHYIGDVPLFGTDAQGNLSIKIEALADIDPTGQLTVWDRDYAGLLQTGHNNVIYGSINLGNVVQQAGKPSSIFKGSTNSSICPPAGGACVIASFLPYTRLEGFDYQGLTFQGDRALENASGQWTTPDAYEGDVHDPMSQKPFMWDRNNPYQYSDPTGFFPQELAQCDCIGHGFYSVEEARQVAYASRKPRDHKKTPDKKGGPKDDKHESSKPRTNRQSADIMGWPQTAEAGGPEAAAAQTDELTAKLSTDVARDMQSKGLTWETVDDWLDIYKKTQTNRKQSEYPVNKARLRYLLRLEEVWPTAKK